MSVCFFSSLSNGEFSDLLILAAFSNNYFSAKTSFWLSSLLAFISAIISSNSMKNFVFFVECAIRNKLIDLLS